MSANEKYIDLKDFLRKHKTIPEKTFTHTSLGNVPHSYPGSYCIDDNELNLFYNLYKKHTFEDGKDAHLTERHKDCSQILIDLDFRHTHNADNSRKYNIDFLNKFVDIYIKELLSLVPTIEKKHLKAYILEKPAPIVQSGKNILKDGIHIMFPYLVSEPKIQYLLRYNMINNADIIELFNTISVINSLEDIFDIAVIERNNWQMYGSCKPNNTTYKLAHILDYSNGKIENIDNKHNELELVKLLSIRNIKDKYKLNIEEFMETIDKKYEEIPKNQKTRKRKKPINKKRKSPTKKNFLDTDEELTFVKDLINILDEKRVDGYDSWIRLGWCLHNIDYRLLESWINISKKSYKFVEGECENEWPLMDNEGLGLGTLYLWAKEDNLETYKKLSEQNLRKCMLDSLTLAPNDIGKVVYHLYKQEFVCSSAKKNTWYQFKNHRWNEIDDAIDLRKKLSDDVVNKYEKLNSYCAKKIENSSDSSEKDVWLARQKMIIKIMSSLKTTSFKKNVIHECNELFHDSKFEDKLDTNLTLLGFENGIYDLDELKFRDGLPEDYIKYSTNINYEEFDDDEEEIEDVKTFLSQVLPKKNVRTYVLTLLGSFLTGKTTNEKFHIWTGCHSKNTKILMYDGTIKYVQDINVKDSIMGPDSTPRIVNKLITGKSAMYEITPSKGEKFVINEDHIMVLKATNILSMFNTKREYRYKLIWQEKDINGYPISKCKNFPYKHKNRKLYKKSVTYYDNELDALEACNNYKTQLFNENNNIIKNGDIIEIPLKIYIKIMNKIGKRNYYLYKVPVDYKKKDIKIDPYLLGYWLGDGNTNNIGITTMDKEIIQYFDYKLFDYNLDKKTYIKKNNKAVTINYSSKEKTKGKNKLLNIFKKYNLINNKHIPNDFKINDRDTRLHVLAGLIDSDGYYNKKCNQYEITQKSEQLIDDILYLVRSLGFSATKKIRNKKCYNTNKWGIYYQIIFYGNNMVDIPVKLERKIARERFIKKDPLKYSFKINKIDDDTYYGFKLNKDHLYLDGNFMVHHNCGGNGKSKLIELFEYAFGDYCCKLPVTLLTQSRGRAEGATPALVRTKGKRFACLQEPDKNEEIHVGLMKELTGGDKIIARGLHKDPVEFKPQFKLVLTCNDLPNVSANDRGTWRRISVVDFPSKFVDDPDPNDKFEFKIDEILDEKLKIWPEAFMYLLLEYYAKFKKYGIKEPEEVKRHTEEYKCESDIFVQFFNDKLVETDNCDNSGIKVDDIYFIFQEWHKEANGNNNKCPSRKDLTSNMNKKYGNKSSNKKIWMGLGFKDKDDIIFVDDGIKID
jgi:P4 family phage/plasmid primase-like protien